ncbi:hypothetical protein HPP92_027084 [Vanilla planifolia]|uniref:Small auxin up regulated protein n=1 Tax=Vanilla planifolia TaxID=51239 RepID=A0A835PDV2_VANPL|nr:hypothetical protein HPP92_027084 [Vanilla planifolia]
MQKCITIHHIVRLLQLLRRWRTRASVAGVPKGHVAVCVGSNHRRYVIRVAHLNHPAFRILLNQAEEEFGFSNRSGPLFLPCEESLFFAILRQICSPGGGCFCRAGGDCFCWRR